MEKQLINALAAYFWTDPAKITSKSRTEPLPIARHLGYGILQRKGIPQKRIAAIFGTTQSGVSKGLKTLYTRMRYDKTTNLELLVNNLSNQLEA